MEEKNFDLKKFRELLKKGIGTRTQKEFAAQTGVANVTINRMLNNDELPCPKMSTLETFAANMSNVTLEELLSACGYEAPTIEDIVQRMESDISDFFSFERQGINIFKNVEDITARLTGFLKRRPVTIRQVEHDTAVTAEMEAKGAENACTIEVEWKYVNYHCITTFDMYYLLTASGKTVLIGSNIDEVREVKGRIRNTRVERVKKTASLKEERLLQAIFGEIYDKDGNPYRRLPNIYAGYGFEYNATPEGFIDFLNTHSHTFCDSEENIKLYNRVIAGEDPDEVFAGYGDGRGYGTGAVVSDIMSKETDKEYLFYEKDKHVPDEEQNACIMERERRDIIQEIDNKTQIYLFQCAKELKLPTFGVVYYRTTCIETKSQMYKTDDFWLCEK